MTIDFKGKEIELKYGFKSLIIYENIANKTFAPQGLEDVVMFFYSVILASIKGEEIVKFDDFLDWLDENPNRLADFSNWITEIIKKNQDLAPIKEENKKEEVKEDTSKN